MSLTDIRKLQVMEFGLFLRWRGSTMSGSRISSVSFEGVRRLGDGHSIFFFFFVFFHGLPAGGGRAVGGPVGVR